MNYEEKYKEALERARVWRDESGMPKNKKGILDDIFPELAESEDEKIRKDIIHLVIKSQEQGGYALHKDEAKEMLAWLEKQKQDEPVDYNNANIQQEDWAENTGYTDEEIIRAIEGTSVLDMIDDKHAEWSEEEEEMLSLIFTCIDDYYRRGLITKKQETAIKDWLKSLKPQNRWKPSDRQMQALEYHLHSTYNNSWQWEETKKLYNDLKKLRGE